MTDADPWATQRDVDIVTELDAAGFEDAVEVGRGGFGVVYRCRQEDLDRTVAVKVLTSTLDADNLERFVREQRAMGRMSGHPHIVDIHQVGTTGSKRPFLVMPYHDHGSLEARLRRDGPLDWPDAVRLGIKIAGALETAHRGSALHRDVKPANILLTDYDEPQLTDFGIARISGGFETTTGTITGSPAFTAPEVLEGREPTAASDVYSLAATVFCAVTGHAAYERRQGEQVVAQFLRISRQPVPDLREAGIPDDLATAIERAMTGTVERRTGTSIEFGDELRAVERNHGLLVDEMQIRGPRTASPHETSGDAPPPPSTPHTPYRLRTPRTPPAPITRFRPPTVTRALVERGRLLDVLRAGQARRLTLIHAPAGFGKSSLAVQWRGELTDAGIPVAWLTIDRDDNNAVWFLSHLLEAIGRVRPDAVAELGQTLEEHGEAVDRFVLTTLINRLHESGEPVSVVIDDWHRATDPATLAAMEFLLDNGCHHLKFVVTSRTRSGLPLNRMRVHDELNEIDSRALSFDLDESHRFLVDRAGLDLDTDDVHRIRESTDGWIAALQLASLSLRGSENPASLLRNLQGGLHAIGDYLAENVLDALDPETLDFLLATAVPDRVCGDLAGHLADIPNGRARLEQVVRHDLFLNPMGEDGNWYRYHLVFADSLHQRLERDYPGRLEQLHRRAYEWFSEHHFLGEAVDQVLAAGEPTKAVELLERNYTYFLDRSRMSTLLGLIAKLPTHLVEASPRLQLTIGWANTELQHRDLATDARNRTLELLGVLELPDDQHRQLRVEADVLKASIGISADRRTAGVRDLVTECLDHPHDHHPFVVSMAAMNATIVDINEFRFDDANRRQLWAEPYHHRTSGPYSVAYGYCYAGLAKDEQLDITGAARWYQRAFQLANDAGNTQSQHARFTRALLAEGLYRQNRITEAEKLLEGAFDPEALGGSEDFMTRHYCLRARIRYLRGDHAAAATSLDEGLRAADALTLPRLRAAVDNERIHLGLHPQPGFTAVTHHQRRTSGDGIDQTTAQLEDETAIMLLARSNDPDQIRTACDWAEEWVHSLDGTGRELARLHATRLQVACLWAAGRTDEAHTALRAAAILCARHNLIRFLPDGGPLVIEAFTALTASADEGPDLPRSYVDAVRAALEWTDTPHD